MRKGLLAALGVAMPEPIQQLASLATGTPSAPATIADAASAYMRSDVFYNRIWAALDKTVTRFVLLDDEYQTLLSHQKLFDTKTPPSMEEKLSFIEDLAEVGPLDSYLKELPKLKQAIQLIAYYKPRLNQYVADGKLKSDIFTFDRFEGLVQNNTHPVDSFADIKDVAGLQRYCDAMAIKYEAVHNQAVAAAKRWIDPTVDYTDYDAVAELAEKMQEELGEYGYGDESLAVCEKPF